MSKNRSGALRGIGRSGGYQLSIDHQPNIDPALPGGMQRWPPGKGSSNNPAERQIRKEVNTMKYSKPQILETAPAVVAIQALTKGGFQHRDNPGMSPATYSPPAYEADE
jgi:hypothetical protein